MHCELCGSQIEFCLCTDDEITNFGKHQMQTQLTAMFSPSVSLIWRGYGGKLTRHYFPNKVADRPLLEQFMREAGISTQNGIKITVEQVDSVIAAASKHGYSVETIGEPETVETPA